MNKGIVILLVVVFSLGLQALPAKQVEIKQFRSNKILYDFNEKVDFESVLVNTTATPLKVKAQVLIKKGQGGLS